MIIIKAESNKLHSLLNSGLLLLVDSTYSRDVDGGGFSNLLFVFLY